VVYVCENNQYAVSTSIKRSMPIARIADRASSYGMPGVSVDGNDVIAVYETVSSMVARARRGKGPSLVECITYRWKGHSKSDPATYRPQGELEEWKRRCPILHLRTLLTQQGIVSQEDMNRIDAEAEKAVADAVAYAQASPEPDPKTTMEGVYA
jgi:pyruvate dehydrogenase E1 component alpha subunit